MGFFDRDAKNGFDSMECILSVAVGIRLNQIRYNTDNL